MQLELQRELPRYAPQLALICLFGSVALILLCESFLARREIPGVPLIRWDCLLQKRESGSSVPDLASQPARTQSFLMNFADVPYYLILFGGYSLEVVEEYRWGRLFHKV